jgi:aminopeptidase N
MQNVSRLYEQFKPHHYQLTWDLSRIGDKRLVNGTAIITGERTNAEVLRLHAKDLKIDTITIDNASVESFTLENDELIITHPGTGSTSVTITFSLTVTDAMHGIYPCYYAVDGVKKELFATQFESHHAREAFPCVDEPEAKATFDVTLLTTGDDLVLSNMPISTQSGENVRTTTFDTTPRMSTYLLAFATGDFQRATSNTKNGVEVNIYATKAHSADSLDFALNHAVRTIEFFDEYFGVPYPLPKSDHVALPDFSSGAMENWGLITYREIALLADPKTISIPGKQYVAEVVAHELSHQWFGNLVTMKWWNNLWLNESFATIMEYLAPSALYPDWNLWFDFSTSEGVMALRRDSIDGVQSVQVDVHHPDEISALFDGAIVYAKGGRLMRMMQTYVGEDAFRSGLKSYFTKYQYSNTTGDDLWGALSEASGKDIGGLMNTWISQSGFPLVKVSLSNGQATLEQEQFFVGPHEDSDQLWPVPTRANSSTVPELFTEKQVSFAYDSGAALHLNSDDSGHYIVQYDDELRSRILDEIKAGTLSDIQRAQFLHEQTLLARGGYISSAQLIELLGLYKNETNERVWDIMALALADLKRFVETNLDAEKQLRAFSAGLARKQFERLGWHKETGESEDDTKLRATIIGCMLYGEEPEVVKQAIDIYTSTKLDDIEPELRSLVIGAAVRHGDDRSVIDVLLNEYGRTSSADIQNDITAGITSTKHPSEITHLLGLLTNKEVIRHQDVIRWFVSILRNREGRAAAWQWMQTHWGWISETFASDKSHDYFPRYTANILSTRPQLQEYTAFFEPLKPQPALTRAIEMGVKDLTGRVELIERDETAVAEALAKL